MNNTNTAKNADDVCKGGDDGVNIFCEIVHNQLHVIEAVVSLRCSQKACVSLE
jgi:hypothetical protein